MIGTVPERVADEIPDCDGFAVHGAGLETDAVGPVDAKFQGVFDGDNPLVFGEQLDERIEQRGLAGPGTARHEDVMPSGQRPPRRIEHLPGHGAGGDQVLGGERAASKAPDGNGHGRGCGRHADGDTRSVIETGIDNRDPRRVESEGPCDLERGAGERRPGQRRGFDLGHFSSALDPDNAGPVDHDLANMRIVEYRLKSREKRPQIIQAPTHIFFSSTARQ